MGIGLAMHAAPIYIAETAPPSARGALVSLKEAMIVGGILLGCGPRNLAQSRVVASTPGNGLSEFGQ